MPHSPNPSQTPTTTGRHPGEGASTARQQQTPVARLPHERDASADSQAGRSPQEPAFRNAAYRDAASGRPDTDRGPVLGNIYNARVRPSRAA